jgi:integrase/recombinase XerC
MTVKGLMLFVSLHNGRGRGSRISLGSVSRLVRSLGEDLDLGVVRAHGLRHTAITTALDVTEGNYRDVAKFSRHADVRTVAIYDDCRRDVAGEVARRVSECRQTT